MRVEFLPRRLAAMHAALALAALAGCASVPDGVVSETNFRDQRVQHWIWWGADAEALQATLARIRNSEAPLEKAGYWDLKREFGPGHWAFEFSALGSATEARAERMAGTDPAAAANTYHEASVYYGLAKYPYVRRDAIETEAYAAQTRTYLRAWELAGMPVEVVEVQWRGKPARGLLHRPPGVRTAVPLVLATNGIDVFSAEFGPFARDLVERGIAFFAFDIPGTGLNVDHVLDPDFDQLHLTFLNALLARGGFNASRVGVMGVSFGGNAAVKLAFTEPDRIAAVLNVCGPVHDVFMIPVGAVGEIEPMFREALFDRLHVPSGDRVALVEAARGFSLLRQGVMGAGVITPVPIYSLNARSDYVATERDMALVTRSSAAGAIAFSGSGDHCPQNRPADMPVAAEWLASRLLP